MAGSDLQHLSQLAHEDFRGERSVAHLLHVGFRDVQALDDNLRSEP
jgi:hypothetical protein